MLKQRLFVGLILGFVFLFTLYIFPPIPACGVLIIISSIAHLEFYSLANMAGIPVFRFVGLVCGIGMILTTFCSLGPTPQAMANAYKWDNILLISALVIVFIRQFPQKYNDKPIPTIACTLVGILYVPFLLNFISRLAVEWEKCSFTDSTLPFTGRILILYLVAVVKCTDMGAYFVGIRWGKHKMAPRISPFKTWEGLAGGIIAGLLSSVGIMHFFSYQFGVITMNMTDGIILGFLLAIAGTMGDMFESLVKRASGAKDSAHYLPGFGGVLDIIDSLLFGAPVFYMYLHFFK